MVSLNNVMKDGSKSLEYFLELEIYVREAQVIIQLVHAKGRGLEIMISMACRDNL